MKRWLSALLVLALSAWPAAAEEEAPRGWYSVPTVEQIEVPDIDVPKVPEKKEDSGKIEIPDIPALELPGAQLPGPAAPEPGEGAKGEAAPAADPAAEAALEALGVAAYRDTYAALLGGEILKRGSKGAAARGLQQTLVAFGQDIAVDGDVGPRTLAALNAVQGQLGLAQTETLDAGGYAALLAGLAAAAAAAE